MATQRVQDTHIETPGAAPGADVDVIVVGAGFAGLYMLYRLREQGFSTIVLEAGEDVGGTWFWNRYPGLRCDIPTTDYCYTWDAALEEEWTWSEKFATQPEILRYLQHVADRYDLRPGIRFSTRVTKAEWDEASASWTVDAATGESWTARHVVMASGALSVPKPVDIDGLQDFAGEVYSTCSWPEEPVDFAEKRVAVVGTGSSGIQLIPLVADQAAQLTVFQRTPAFSLPARNGAPPAHRVQRLAEDRQTYREEARWSSGGVPLDPPKERAEDLSEVERVARLEEAWAAGEIAAVNSVFADHLTNKASNDFFADFIRSKIRSIVKDPATAEKLCPTDYPFMAKRPCFDTGYYETFNKPHVQLHDLRSSPIVGADEKGLVTVDGLLEVDAIVLATGYDALTGALMAIDIAGRDGLTLRQKWADGPATYLGLMSSGFPNLYMITGPGSPSVLSNMVVAIEQHVDWVARCLVELRRRDVSSIEPTPAAEQGWVQHVLDCAEITLFPAANSWYLGANVPGKPRVFMPYVGGVGVYRQTCDSVLDRDFLGFELTGAAGTQRSDEVVNHLQPDVADLVRTSRDGCATTLTGDLREARKAIHEARGTRPGGREIFEVVEGVVPGADGELPFRLYRPDQEGPHPVVVYLPGGGWVLDDPWSEGFCRDLAARAGVAVLEVAYRRAPEAPFPAAVLDAYAATRFASERAVELGGIPGQVAIAGWGAGANLAAVVAQMARDAADAPDIGVQVLINPITDVTAIAEGSQAQEGEYGPRAESVNWLVHHYAGTQDLRDPRISPARSTSLVGLAPAVVVTSEFDSLRSQGEDYADALEEAGVPVHRIAARGHVHASLPMVALLSGDPVRAQIATTVREVLNVDSRLQPVVTRSA
ncbi:flavin-containing monooxygenase [Nocardioides sp.]|uniref:flavin-containing monooxygenase n=1 Tax=Nocardioides sp. TaxID=35761 RepID=UPI003D0E1ABF